ncbi:MAG: ERAP1-like C-terminal domain-containing protein [Shewanella sp.]
MTLFIRASAWLMCALFLTACQSIPLPLTNKAKSDAELLAQRLSDISYAYQMTLSPEDTFSVKADIDFKLDDNQKDLPLDLQQAHIQQLIINGQNIYPNYNGKVLSLPARLLQSGNNHIQLSYQGYYRQQGQGLIRVIDPNTQQVYLYSRFEPHGASHPFALFDKPGLRGKMSLHLEAPSDWQVISTMVPKMSSEASTTWEFAQTPPLSPHQFALFAGPFSHWQYQQDGVQFRLFALNSTQDDERYEQWLRLTADNLKRIGHVLATPYPFTKFDQILLPGLSDASMSQAAAVSVTERLPLDAKPISQHMQNSQLLAKQWFGSLISLPWWDDLYLHAGLGLYLANQTAINAGIDASAQEQYQFLQQKQPAYKYQLQHESLDPLSATATEIQAQQFLAVKSAAELNQIAMAVGERKFTELLQTFIQRHSWQSAGNQAWRQLLAPLGLERYWTHQTSGGINSISAQWQCQDGVLERLSITQTEPHFQKVKVALFYKNQRDFQLDKTLLVTLKELTTEVTNAGHNVCPDFVYPNFQDMAYGQVLLDEKSQAAAIRHLSQISDPLMQMMLLEDIWQASLTDKLPLNDYLGMIMLNLPNISAPSVQLLAQQQLQQLHQLLRLMPTSSAKQRIYNALEQFSLHQIYQQGPTSIWLDSYLQFAQSDEAMDHLQSLLNGYSWPLTQEQRWQAITRLNQFGRDSRQSWLNKEAKRDTSLLGQQHALIASMATPNAALKRRYLSELSQAPYSMRASIISKHLYPGQQPQAQQAAFEQIRQVLPELVKQAPHQAEAIVSGLVVLTCRPDNIHAIEQELTTLDAGALKDAITNHLLVMKQCQQFSNELGAN